MLTSKILSSICLAAGPFASTFAPAASAEPSVPGSDRPTGVVVFPLQHANERSGARYAANGAPPSHRSDEHYVHAHSLHTHHDIAQGIGVSSLSGMADESGADSANKQASNSNIREVPGVEEAAAIVAKNSASAPLVGTTERVAGFVGRRIGGQSAAGPPSPPSSNSVSSSSSSVSSFAAVPVITSRKDEKTNVDDGLKEVREETAEARTAGKEKEEPQESTTPAAGANYKSDAVQLETPSTDAPAAAAGEPVAEETTAAPAEVTTAAAQAAASEKAERSETEKAERSETEKPGKSETETPRERETEQPAASEETEKPVATETEKPKPVASETENAATTETAPEAETASTAAAAAPAADASTGAPASSSLVTTGSPASDPLPPRFTAPPAAAIAAEAAKTGDHTPEPVGSSAVPSGVDPTAVSRKDDPEPSMSSEAPSKSASVGETVETATGTASEAPVAGEPSTAGRGPTSETPAASSTEAPAAGASSTSEAPSSSQGAEDSPSAPETGDEKGEDRRPDKAPATTHKASESNRAGETSRENTTAPPDADTTSSSAAAVTVPCVDDPVFRDAQGHKCKEWTPEWCSNPDPSYSEADIAAVHAHCKKKCKLCKLQPECKDDDAFKDAKGYSCRQWSPADCRASSLEGYTKADLRAVRRRCRQSCELCGESGAATTTARPSDSGKSFDAYGALKTSESEGGNSDSNTSGSTSTANTGGENKDKGNQPLQQHGVKIESVATVGDLVVARVVNPGGRLRCCLSRAKLRAALITKPELPSSTSCEETSYSRTQQFEFSTTYRLFPLTPGSKYVVSCATVRKTSEEESSSRHRDVVVSEKVAYEPASTAATSPASSSEDSTSSGPKRRKKNSSSSSSLSAVPKELPSPSVSPKKNKSSSGSGLPDLVSNTNDADHLQGRIRDEVSRFDETGFSIRPSWKKPRTEMKSKSSSASSAGSSSSRSKYDEDDEDGGARKSKDSASTSSSSSLFSAGRWIPLVVVLGFLYFVCWRGNVGKWLLVKMRVVESDDDIELTRTSYSTNRQSRGSYQPPNVFGAPSAA